ncbi:MAG TPA: hypothetical protein VIJ31_11705 [Acidothermaceae bacterium]
MTVTALPTVALAGALTEKWVAVAAFATPVAKNEIGTAISAVATKRAYLPARDFARTDGRGVVTSLIVPPLDRGLPSSGLPDWLESRHKTRAETDWLRDRRTR